MLAGCSSNGPGLVTGLVMAEVRGQEATAPAEPNPATTIDRQTVERLGLAMVRLTVPSSGTYSLVTGKSMRAGRVTYIGANNRTLVFHGHLLVSTHGYGTDMNPVAPHAGDPVAFPRPLRDWPGSAKRTYNFNPRGPQARSETVTCTYRDTGPQEVTILGTRHATVRMREDCASDTRSFTNVYNVDAGGQVWQSAQWTGPMQGYAKIEVLEPLD